MRVAGLLIMVGVVAVHPCAAGELVDGSSPLRTVRAEFGLADGPAWDGENMLYVPDVKAGTLNAFQPESDSWSVVLPDAGRISATYFSSGRLYLSDNGEAGVSRLEGQQKIEIFRNDPNAKPARRPNDLVVDATGGIYCTLTAAKQVVYVSPAGEQRVAVDEIESPNGIILSPNGRTLYVSAYIPKEILAYDVTGRE